jgi:demethylmacrocin O-methyltransferase
MRLNILEIGVGGYGKPFWGACSLRMWKAYFRRSRIVGIDIHEKSHVAEKRIDIRQCHQTDADRLRQISHEYGGFDIIIDDGSHLNQHVVRSFEILFPLLRLNGIYAIEDLQTAYWPSWGGGIGCPESSMAFFKGLVDGLNYVEYPVRNYNPTYYDQHITEITFFHNIVLIHKGLNDEGTSQPKLISREIEMIRASQGTEG